MAGLTSPRRGEVYLVNFDPTVGSEIRKTRPALIIQNDIANEHSPITIVAAVTSRFDDKLYPTEVLIKAGRAGMTQDSVVLLNQVRSIDRARLIKRLGIVDEKTLERVNSSLKVSFGLVDLS